MNKKWRVINNNKIQTWASNVWLWDENIGVAVLAPRQGRPWTKINKDFTHWIPADDHDKSPPDHVPEGCKNIAQVQAQEMLSTLISKHDPVFVSAPF